MCEEVQGAAVGVAAREVALRRHAGAQPALATPVPAAYLPSPPRVMDEFSDEDPFRHALLGFDGPAPRIAQDEEAMVGAPFVSQAAASLEEGPSGQLGKGAHPSHALRRTAHIIWCAHCGRHAATRLGVGLMRQRRGVAEGAYPTRIQRLKSGLSPTTGDPS